MAVKLSLLIFLLTACTGSTKNEGRVTDTGKPSGSARVTDSKDLATLHAQLATARDQSKEYLFGDALPVAKDVRALVEKDSRDWWNELTPLERFFLFEISPSIAARAPAEIRAEAYCAGVEKVNAEWWSTPGSRSDGTKRMIASKTPIAPCLVKLFDSTSKLDYEDGESNIRAEQLKWTVGDLAAGIVALSLGEDYNNRATPEARAARRAELRAKVH